MAMPCNSVPFFAWGNPVTNETVALQFTKYYTVKKHNLAYKLFETIHKISKEILLVERGKKKKKKASNIWT